MHIQKAILMATVAGSLAFAGVSHAQNTSSSSAAANSGSVAIGNLTGNANNSLTSSATAQGGGGGSAQSSSTSSSQGGAATSTSQGGNAAAQGGASSAQSGGSTSNVSLVQKAPDAIVAPSNNAPVIAATPQIFAPGRFTAPGLGAMFENAFDQSCAPQEYAFGDMRGDIEPGYARVVDKKGKAEMTQVASVTFTPLPGLRMQAEWAQHNSLPLAHPARVSGAFPADPGAHIVCLGTVTVSAVNPNADGMMLKGIVAEIVQQKMDVFKKRVYMVSAPQVQAAANGVHTAGSGYGVNAGTGTVFTGIMSSLGLAGGYASNKGDALSFDNVGSTFLVFETADDDESGPVQEIGTVLNGVQLKPTELVAGYKKDDAPSVPAPAPDSQANKPATPEIVKH